jgi:hypothetical protein
MNKLQKAALAYVAALGLLVYGYAVGQYDVFPARLLAELEKNFQAFSQGDPTEKKTTILQKLKNDIGLSPERYLYPYPAVALDGAAPVEYSGFSQRSEPPYVFVDPEHRKGYRVVAGVLNLPDNLWGAVLLNPDGKVIHSWQLTTKHLAKGRQDHREALYGMHLFPDGSIVFNMQEFSGGLVKVDACSNVLWNLEGKFHHAVVPDQHGYFWTFIGSQLALDQDLARVSVETGKIDRIIKMQDVRAANPDLHIWHLQDDSFKDPRQMVMEGNMTHGNDVDPLPSSLAQLFPGFSADDLVISYATTNLVFVLDPNTLKIEWWQVGISGEQHDPDWEPDGRIVIYSNNRRLKPNAASTIVAVRPSTNETEVIFRGDRVDFISPVNGRHQLTPFGTRMVTSARQGWAFEIDKNDKIVFSFINNADSQDRHAMFLSTAWHLGEDYFEDAFWERCSKES